MANEKELPQLMKEMCAEWQTHLAQMVAKYRAFSSEGDVVDSMLTAACANMASVRGPVETGKSLMLVAAMYGTVIPDRRPSSH